MIKSLAYVGVNSPRAEDWRRFGTGFLGGELAPDGPDGAVRLRVDDAAWRLEIHPAEEDSVAFFGWAGRPRGGPRHGRREARRRRRHRRAWFARAGRRPQRRPHPHLHRPVGLPARGDLGPAPLPLDVPSRPARAPASSPATRAWATCCS